MTDDGKQELVECLQQTAIFTKQLIRLNVLDLAIKAAQEGADGRPLLKRLEALDSVVLFEQKVKKLIDSEAVEGSKGS
jgi:hypothetical protein